MLPAEAVSLVARARGARSSTRSSTSSASRRNTLQRDSSAALTAKLGFSVVAPTSDDRAVLDVRQERVLLGLVESVDLVDEDDRPLALEAQAIARGGDDLAQLPDAPEHGAEGDEVRLRGSGDDARERRLAAPRRTPQDHRANTVGRDRLGQERLRPEDVLLADQVGERLRPHPVGQRSPALGALLRRRGEERARPVVRRAARARGHGRQRSPPRRRAQGPTAPALSAP